MDLRLRLGYEKDCFCLRNLRMRVRAALLLGPL